MEHLLESIHLKKQYASWRRKAPSRKGRSHVLPLSRIDEGLALLEKG